VVGEEERLIPVVFASPLQEQLWFPPLLSVQTYKVISNGCKQQLHLFSYIVTPVEWFSAKGSKTSIRWAPTLSRLQNILGKSCIISHLENKEHI